MQHSSTITATSISGLPSAGTWRLKPFTAITLNPPIDAKICPQVGGLWITLGAPRVGSGADRRDQDIFLSPGDTLIVAQGAVAVIEPWGKQASEPCYFTWHAVLPELTLPIRRATAWALHIGRPWQDLKTATVQGAGAALRLTWGLLTWPWSGRGLAKCVDGAAQI